MGLTNVVRAYLMQVSSMLSPCPIAYKSLSSVFLSLSILITVLEAPLGV